MTMILIYRSSFLGNYKINWIRMERIAKRKIGNIFEKYEIVKNEFKYYNKVA